MDDGQVRIMRRCQALGRLKRKELDRLARNLGMDTSYTYIPWSKHSSERISYTKMEVIWDIICAEEKRLEKAARELKP